MVILASMSCGLVGASDEHSAPLASSVAISPPRAVAFQPEPATSPASVGPGEHRVGPDIMPGRYFGRPSAGCYWERRSGTGDRRLRAFAHIGDDAAQWIVDVRESDYFSTNNACGRWSYRRANGEQMTIRHGVWLVGKQVTPGRYFSLASTGCYWERLRDFAGTIHSVVARELIGASGPAFVTILATDTGFRTDPRCGVWTHSDPASAQ
jgi:hypothetical protein